MVHARFAGDLLTAMIYAYQHGYQPTVSNVRSSLIPIGRWRTTRGAYAMKADRLMFFDSDMMFPPETIVRFAELDLPVVAAAASRRAPPFKLCATAFEGQDLIKDMRGDQPFQVARVGTAVMMISRAVITAVPEPWFTLDWTENGWRGEDSSFCDGVRAAGFGVFVDPVVSRATKHVGIREYGWQDVLASV